MAQPQKSRDGLRIVSVVWFKVLPPLFGGQKGVALFNEHLGRLAPLYCICSRNNETIPASYQMDASLPVTKTQFINPLCWRKIYRTCKELKATHLILEFPYYGIAGWLCKKLLGVKLIVHSHNIEAFRFKAQKKWWWRLLFVYEKWTLRRADAIFFKTEKDRQTAFEHFNLKKTLTSLVPYGLVKKDNPDRDKAKEIIYQRHGITPGTKLLLFAGTLDYGPNAEAVEAIEKKLVPLLQQQKFPFTVLLCGRIAYKAFSYLKTLQNKHLVYVGQVTDIDRYFAAADVFLNPVATGGGVQTKIIDALSFHLNVVCFENMTDGIDGAEAKLFPVPRNDWQAFAAAIAEALKRKTLTPPDFFERHYWNKIAEISYNLIRQL